VAAGHRLAGYDRQPGLEVTVQKRRKPGIFFQCKQTRQPSLALNSFAIINNRTAWGQWLVEEGREFRFRGDLYSQESTFPLVWICKVRFFNSLESNNFQSISYLDTVWLTWVYRGTCESICTILCVADFSAWSSGFRAGTHRNAIPVLFLISGTPFRSFSAYSW